MRNVVEKNPPWVVQTYENFPPEPQITIDDFSTESIA